MVITWLDFGGILLETLFLPNVLRKFQTCFFKVKHFIGHISGMVGPIDVKQKGGASVGYWVNYVTFTFDLIHVLDLWFFKVKFQNSCIWGIVIVRRAGLLWSQQDFEWRWSVPLFKCLTVLEFSFILFDLCLLITFFNFIMNYVPIVTFWIFTYHKIWILSIMFCSIWSYWIIYFLACLEVSWRVVS